MEFLLLLCQSTSTLLFFVVAYFLLDFFRLCRKFANKVRRASSTYVGRQGRSLEAMEARWEHLQRSGVSNFSVAFFVESRAPLEEAALTAALRRVAAANPMLRMRISAVAVAADEDLLFFEEMKEFRPDLERLDTEDWKATMEKELGTPFHSKTGPLWRVKMLQGAVDGQTHRRVLILTFHHALADGKSAMALGDRLMDELSNESVEKWRTMFDAELAPSYVELFGKSLMRISRLRQLRLYLRLKLLGTISAQPRCRPSYFVTLLSRPQTPINHRSRFISVKLNVEDFDKLLRRCRLHGCKLQGALQAAVSLAQIEALNRLKSKDSKLPDFIEIRNFYAESTRDCVQPPLPASVIGYYVFSPSMSRKVSAKPDTLKGDFWTLAKSMSDEIHRRKSEERVESSSKDAEFVYRAFPSFWLKSVHAINAKTFRRSDLSVDYYMSNLGKFYDDDAAPRRFDISAAYSAANFALSDICFGHVVLSLRRRLFWTINFAEGVFSAKEAKVYAECVEASLVRVAGGRLGGLKGNYD